MNLVNAKSAVENLKEENKVLLSKIQKLNMLALPTIIVLLGMSITFNVNFAIFAFVLIIARFLNVRHLQREIFANNYVILITHSCIQAEYDKNYNPANDELVQNKDLIS